MIPPVYKIIVYGNPVAQGRARSRIIKSKTGKPFVSHYDPEKSRNYKDLVRQQILIQGKPEALLDIPLVMSCRIYRLKPKSTPKKVIYPTTKPDLDNYLKSIKDALSGIVIRDDSIIVGYRYIFKLYTLDAPRVEFELYEAGDICKTEA